MDDAIFGRKAKVRCADGPLQSERDDQDIVLVHARVHAIVTDPDRAPGIGARVIDPGPQDEGARDHVHATVSHQNRRPTDQLDQTNDFVPIATDDFSPPTVANIL